jgi:hypothetical protein
VHGTNVISITDGQIFLETDLFKVVVVPLLGGGEGLAAMPPAPAAGHVFRQFTG